MAGAGESELAEPGVGGEHDAIGAGDCQYSLQMVEVAELDRGCEVVADQRNLAAARTERTRVEGRIGPGFDRHVTADGIEAADVNSGRRRIAVDAEVAADGIEAADVNSGRRRIAVDAEVTADGIEAADVNSSRRRI